MSGSHEIAQTQSLNIKTEVL